MLLVVFFFFFFFFNDTATTEIYTLSLHDALPISCPPSSRVATHVVRSWLLYAGVSDRRAAAAASPIATDRKSTRLNSSHLVISYAVFCLKKKNNKHNRELSDTTADNGMPP